MRIQFKTAAVPTRAAKRLKKLLSLPESTAREWTAYVFGYRNWQELLGQLEATAPSSFDDECDEAEVATRRRYQIQRISECLAAERSRAKPVDASKLVAEWKPSGGKPATWPKLKVDFPRHLLERTVLQLIGIESHTPVSKLPPELVAKLPLSLQSRPSREATVAAQQFMRKGTPEEQAFAREVLAYLHTRGNLGATKELARSFALGVGGEADLEYARALYQEVILSPAASPPFKLAAEDGLMALKGEGDGWPGDILGALAKWEEKALAGSAEYAYRTALSCDPYKALSREAKVDLPKAVRFYRKAAMRDYEPAVASLATILGLHPELCEYFGESNHWLELAAAEGDPVAQTFDNLVAGHAEKFYARFKGPLSDEACADLLRLIPEKERGEVRQHPTLGELVPVPPDYLIHLSTGHLYTDVEGKVERMGDGRVATSIVDSYPRTGTPFEKAGWVSDVAEIFGRFSRYRESVS